MRVNELKMRTRSPLGRTSPRILSSAMSFDEAPTMCSSTVSSPSGSELGSRYGCEQLRDGSERCQPGTRRDDGASERERGTHHLRSCMRSCMSFLYSPASPPFFFSSSTSLRICAIACLCPWTSPTLDGLAPLLRSATASSSLATRARARPLPLPVAAAACCLAPSSAASSGPAESPKSSVRVPRSERVRRREYQKRWIGERGR